MKKKVKQKKVIPENKKTLAEAGGQEEMEGFSNLQILRAVLVSWFDHPYVFF